MITQETLRQDPSLITLLTGLPAETFWQLVQDAEREYPAYEHQRWERPGRQRAVGGGRKFDLPLVIRIAMLLTYLRLHILQALVAKLFGGTQSDVSRDLRRLLPLLKQLLPVPEVWQVVETPQELTERDKLVLSDLADGQALVDATEQQVYRSKDSLSRKAHYSGKKKMFTLKTQFVTDGEHHIKVVSSAVAGAKNDKKLSDETQTVERLPDGCKGKADKGYQGLDKQVSLVTVVNAETGELYQVPRLTMETPFKKPKGGELTEEQVEFNRLLNSIRVRVEHCIGWVKNWKIISTRFRCAHQIYDLVMQVVCGLVNWQTQRWQIAKALVAT
jgi:hypothetical protein